MLKKIIISLLSLVTISTLASPQNIYYKDIGTGKPLILIHAFPFDSRLWLPQEKELQKHFRLITIDLAGFGLSAGKKDGAAITMTEYADQVHQVLAQLEIEKAIFGGESMGGYVSLAYLKKYPNEVDGLILSDTQAIADTQEQQNKREITALDILANGTRNFIEGFLPKALSANASEKIRLAARYLMLDQKPYALASALRGMAIREDTSNVLAKTQVPVLILAGDQDAVISPQQSEAMHQLAKNSQYIIIKNAGHLSNLEQPKEWNQAIIDTFGNSN